MTFFYNNLGIRTMIVCFYLVLIGLIKRLNGYRNHEEYILIILFYGNRNVCLGFV